MSTYTSNYIEYQWQMVCVNINIYIAFRKMLSLGYILKNVTFINPIFYWIWSTSALYVLRFTQRRAEWTKVIYLNGYLSTFTYLLNIFYCIHLISKHIGILFKRYHIDDVTMNVNKFLVQILIYWIHYRDFVAKYLN